MTARTEEEHKDVKEEEEYKKVRCGIRYNGRNKLLVIGKTGTGKSSLCNVITGHPHDATIYPVSANPESCTQKTQFANVLFNGNHSKPISLIDTIGFDDATKKDDAAIIAELVDKLNNECDHVNLFMIAINGQAPRLDGSLLTMIKIFEGMFTEKFWQQTVLVFTRISQDPKTKKKRETNNKMTDEEYGQEYIKLVEQQFPNSTQKELKFLYLDAQYDPTDVMETDAFQTSISALGNMLDNSPPLLTENVRKVETQSQELKRKINEVQEERDKMEKELFEKIKKISEDNKASNEEKDQQIKKIVDKFEQLQEERDKMEMEMLEKIKKISKDNKASSEEKDRQIKELQDRVIKELMDKSEAAGFVTRVVDMVNPIRWGAKGIDHLISIMKK